MLGHDDVKGLGALASHQGNQGAPGGGNQNQYPNMGAPIGNPYSHYPPYYMQNQYYGAPSPAGYCEHGEKQSHAMQTMKKRVIELKKLCSRLEDVDQSRIERFERSITDEASGQALRTLLGQLSTLEGQNQELVHREEEREARIRELEATEEDARAEVEQLLVYIEELEGTNAQLREQPELQPVAEGQNDLHKLVSKLEEELEVAEELEAQWERTEKTEKRMSRLQEENDELKHQVGDLRGDFDKQGLRIEELEELNRELDAQAAQHIQQLEAEHEEVHKLFQFCSLMVD